MEAIKQAWCFAYNSQVDAETRDRLIDLNRRFYQTFARPFAETRARLQPGVLQILDRLPPQAAVLDLGCGAGTLAIELARREHTGPYVGLDFSAELLRVAEASVQEAGGLQAAFLLAELGRTDWTSALPLAHFDRALAFAVLHHLPDHEVRVNLLRRVRELLARRGRFIHSCWQFLNSERLRERIQPWSAVGLSPGRVDPGDYLLDWRREGRGLRYVHHFSPEELADLAAAAGFEILETFHADGEGGNLGLYQTWKKN